MRIPVRTAACVAALTVLVGCGPTDHDAEPTATPTVRTTAAPDDPGARPQRLVLNPAADPSTAQNISWLSPATDLADQRVEIREPDGTVRTARGQRANATAEETSGNTLPHYFATVDELRPATAYEYRVLNARGHSPWIGFTTAADSDAPLTFLALGDTQVDYLDGVKPVTDKAFADHPEASLVIQAGDIVNHPYEDDEWRDLFTVLGSKIQKVNLLGVIGNHEQCVLVRSCDSNHAEAFRAHFTYAGNGVPELKDSSWFVDVQGVRFIGLDWFGGHVDEQTAFLDRALTRNPGRWSVVVMHAPVFADRPGRSFDEIRATWLPVMRTHDVDLVLTGHDHSYGRGYVEADGTAFSMSVSGPKFYDITPSSRNDWTRHGATRAVSAAHTATYVVVHVDGDTLRYRAVVAAKDEESTTEVPIGGVLDSFTITRSGDGSKHVK